MGETGCGKTRLVDFFSLLHQRNLKKNLIHVKIHGGTTAHDIHKKLIEAVELSKRNLKEIQGSSSEAPSNTTPITAILFFDEANTTEEIGLIKEIMCDRTVNGENIDLSHGLKIIAAVNPYRKHSKEMIEKLESAGLGFYISSSESKDKLGHIPMRQLVYRVQPLPSSFLPLVWDFGQLDKGVENVYIRQMICKAINDNKFTKNGTIKSEISLDDKVKIDVVCKLLSNSQHFMRSRNDECSFVSMRDIQRVITVSSWFLSKENLIFPLMDKKEINHLDNAYQATLEPLYRAFILALSVCYHAALYSMETRRGYRKILADCFKSEADMDTDASSDNDWVLCEILKCQHVFLDQINVHNSNKNIACNQALLENVFMMIVCIELRIPLFIVGKPGSSKSLAKSIVTNAMQGRNSESKLFQKFKEPYFINFQCSPLTTSEMIVKAFEEAAKFQESVDLSEKV